MKTFILILFSVNILVTNAQIDTSNTSKIQKELNKIQVIHSVKSWQIASIKSKNNINITIDAIEYKNLNDDNSLKGIKLFLSFKNQQYTTYIDKDDYSEIMVVLNQLITEYNNKITTKEYGDMSYRTATGIEIGFNYSKNNNNSYISLPANNKNILCLFPVKDNFLENLLEYINIASNNLYLPKNIKKRENVKKRKSNTNNSLNININDI
jgi:hypothetical protein